MATSIGKPGIPRTIAATEFKARCLKLMDEVAESGEEIIITKRGKPVAKLSAHLEEAAPRPKRPKTLFGAGRGRMKVSGDIVSPIDVEWGS